MENLQEKPQIEAVSGENETPKYDFAPEAHLNPESMEPLLESNAENKIEIFNARVQYQEMIGDMVMEKVLRPNMTDAEIEEVARLAVEKYEEPLLEETEQEEGMVMTQETTANQKEVELNQENKISPLSRAIELMSGWLTKHPAWAKTAMGAVVASELAGCATGGGYYGGGYTAQQMISTGVYGLQQGISNEAYGIQRQRGAEVYGVQRANSQVQYGVQQAQNWYRQAMRAEDSSYRQSFVQPLNPEMKREIDSRHYANIENIKAQYQEQMNSIQQNYNNTVQETQMQTENIRMDTEAQRQNIRLGTGVQILNQAIQGLMYGR